MSKVDARKGIIRDLLASDQDALDKVAETVRSMVKASDRTAGQLAKLIDETECTKARIADASAHLEQELHSGAQLLRELHEQTTRLEAAEAEVDAHKRESEQATARLGQRMAELSVKRQQLEEARAEAEAEIRVKSELLASKESLEAQVQELTTKCQELEEAQETVEAKTCDKSRALTAISQDPYEPVGGMISLIERLQDSKLDVQHQRHLRVALLSLTAMQHLLESALVPQGLLRIPTPDANRRVQGRLPQELLQSNLGPVLDLSMGGMRVRCSRAPKGEVDVDLMGLQAPVRLRAEVMWTRRQGLRKYEVGLKFVDISPDVAKQLTELSLNHSLRQLLATR